MENKPKKSMEQVVYETLKEAILNRTLAPGIQLVESTISDRMKVSRTPIRNAIKRLYIDGFVTIIPNKGAFIIQPSVDEIIQAYKIRGELECIALRFGIDKLEKRDVNTLKGLVKKEVEQLKKQDIFKYFTINKEFHMMLARKSGNKYLIEFMEKIINQIIIYLLLYDAFYNSSLQFPSINDHKQMIELIDKKDVKSLEVLIKDHIISSLNDLQIDKIKYKSLNEIF
ncbi:GntR family transcriptional regulator [Clostridium rectalis]|uniref:GntR family transcriptional regulator n=1 Tax=Clostridium rectalis TaxID=2040295 RepID=UPI000F6432A0|nr:GntR family transcriptional regulator [Clostridium rectalis]